MRVIIAGTRDFEDYDVLKRVMEKLKLDITLVVSGGATGVDTLGERYATENNIPVKRFLPDWRRHGRAAGIVRNAQMACEADALVALWDWRSLGTRSMITIAQRKGLAVYIEYVHVRKQKKS